MKAIIIIGILSITGLEVYAIYSGHNGTVLKIAIGSIAGIIGLLLPTPRILRQRSVQ